MNILEGPLFCLPQALNLGPGSQPKREADMSSKLLAVMALSPFVREFSETHCVIGEMRNGGMKMLKNSGSWTGMLYPSHSPPGLNSAYSESA